jgi:2-keto-4-pentenoate hydratase/2-oxohepta-3-ene-1,7-dioic acid hydratase in catechol pathway
MQLVRFRRTGSGAYQPGLLAEGRVHDLSASHPSLSSFLAEHADGWSLRQLPPKATSYPIAEVELGAPVDDGANVYLVGANYRKHALEAGLDVPKIPVIFQKPTTALVGPGQPIRIPPVTTQMDYEGELAVVIGRRARGVKKSEAARYVAGLTLCNDVTARDLQWVQLGKNNIVDWFSSKCLDRSSPLGPWIVPVSVVGDPHKLRLSTHLNGELMQDGETALMVFNVWDLMEFVTARVTLNPGDVISTGTPFGVGGFRKIFLKPGDVVRVEVAGVGVLENRVEREAA